MKNELTAKRLRLALDNMGMKSQELSDRSGVSKSSISQYINGSHAPSNLSSGKMGQVLGVNPLWLMGFDAPMECTSQSLSEKVITTLRDFKQSEEKDIIDGLTLNLVQLNKNGLNKVVSYTNDLLNIDEYRKVPLESRSYLTPQAAHERTDIEVTDEMRQHDDDIMNDDNF